jgi:hypothetical protein
MSELLRLRADPNTHARLPHACANVHSPLAISAEKWGRSGADSHYQVVLLLVKHGADTFQSDQHGMTVLMRAAKRGDSALMEVQLVVCKLISCHTVRGPVNI